MTNLKILISVITFFVGHLCLAQTGSDTLCLPPKPDGQPITLLGITGVNSIYSDSTEQEAEKGGGLEMERMFSTQYYPDLKPCANEIHATFRNWIVEQNMIVAKNIISDTEVRFEIWQPDRKGLFELKYICSLDGTYARSWVNYYTLTGEKIAIETINELYVKYNINNLWNNLQKSMACSIE